MATLEQLQARLEALDVAIASGVLRVEHNGRSVTYQSLADLLRARALVESQIAELNGTSRRRVRYAYQSDKGL